MFVLDIVGSIALDKLTSFFKKLDENSEVGGRIRNTLNSMSEDHDAKKEGH
jgi:hypothetical protein